MSTINNIPFDINRTPTETNKVEPKLGSKPVQPSEAIHPTEVHDPVSNDRRKKKDRRNKKTRMLHERRLLKQRRADSDQTNTEADKTEARTKPGHIIDFNV